MPRQQASALVDSPTSINLRADKLLESEMGWPVTGSCATGPAPEAAQLFEVLAGRMRLCRACGCNHSLAAICLQRA